MRREKADHEKENAAVHVYRGAGEIIAVDRGEEGDRGCDFRRVRGSAERDLVPLDLLHLLECNSTLLRLLAERSEVHRGCDVSRRHGIYANFVCRELRGRAVGQRDQRRLRSAIGAEETVSGAAVPARNGYDRAAAGRLDHRRVVLDEDHIGADVDIEDPIPFCKIERLDRPNLLQHRRDQTKEFQLPPEVVDRRVDRLEIALFGDIDRNADNLAACRRGDLSRDVLDRLRDVDEHQVPAILGETLGGDLANAARGTRNDSDIAHLSTIPFFVREPCRVRSKGQRDMTPLQTNKASPRRRRARGADWIGMRGRRRRRGAPLTSGDAPHASSRMERHAKQGLFRCQSIA